MGDKSAIVRSTIGVFKTIAGLRNPRRTAQTLLKNACTDIAKKQAGANNAAASEAEEDVKIDVGQDTHSSIFAKKPNGALDQRKS